MSPRRAMFVPTIGLLFLTVPGVAQDSPSSCAEGASGSVVGVVTDETGGPVPGTRVVVGSHQSVTDEHGEFFASGVCPGRYLVSFAPPMDSNLMADAMANPTTMVTVEVTAGKVTRIRRALRAGGRIDLTVEREGQLLTPEAMKAISTGGSIELFADRTVYRGDPEVEGGHFVFWGLEPQGGYRLEFELNGFVKYVRRDISVAPRETTSVVIDFAPDQSTGVAGTLIRTGGAAPGQYVSVAHEVNPDWMGAALTDQQGKFSVLGLPPGNYIVSTYGEVLGRVTVSSGEISTVEFEMSE